MNASGQQKIKTFRIDNISKLTPTDEKFKKISEMLEKNGGKPIGVSILNDLNTRQDDLQTKVETKRAEARGLKCADDCEQLEKLASVLEGFENELGKIKEEKKTIMKDINFVIESRRDAQGAYSHWNSTSGGASRAVRFQAIVNKSNKLLAEYDKEEKQKRTDKKQKKKDALESQKSKRRKTTDVITIDEEEEQAQEEFTIEQAKEARKEDKAATDANFTPAVPNDQGRKTKPLSKASEKPTYEAGKDGSGLFTKSSIDKVIKENNLNKNHFEWKACEPAQYYGKNREPLGRLKCMCCNEYQKWRKSLDRHVNSANHKKKAKADVERNNAKDNKMAYRQTSIDTSLKNTLPSLEDDLKHCRMDGIRAAASANITLTELADLEDSDWLKNWGHLEYNLGDENNLARDITHIVHEEDLATIRDILGGKQHVATEYVGTGNSRSSRRKYKKRQGLNYQHFSLIFDGTPSFAEAEAIMIRVVMRDGQILNLLIRCALFKKKLTGENIANHLESAVKLVGLDMKFCKAVMCDRASTNKSAIDKLNETYPDVEIVPFFCWSHTFSNGGKRIYSDKNTPYMDSFRKKWQKVIQHKGKARDLAASLFKKAVKEAGGIRFYVHYEQIVQIVDFGLEKVLRDIIPQCIANGWSELSSNNLMDSFGTSETKADLAMAMLEGCAIADGGKSFCESCYTLEGTSPLIFTASKEIGRLQDMLQSNEDVKLKRFEDALPRILQLLDESHASELAKKDQSDEYVRSAEKNVASAEAIVEEVSKDYDIARGITTGSSSRGRARKKNNKFQDKDLVEIARTNVAEAKLNLKKAREEVDVAKKESNKRKANYEAWCAKYPLTEEDLKKRAKEVVKGGAVYLKNQFLEPNGDMFHAAKAASCCNTLFNPLWLKGRENDLPFVESHVELLKNFRFREFEGGFPEELKKEIPRIIQRANDPTVFDWDRFDSSRLFKTRLERRKCRLGKQNVDEDWKKDLGEVATRIWEWWRPIIAEENNDFPAFKSALKLIGLLQVSSCDVERVFSQLQRVRSRCGENLLEDMLEVRMFALCNGSLKELWNASVQFPLEDVVEDEE